MEPSVSRCDHGRKPGCLYCPTCGARYVTAPEPAPRGGLGWLLAPVQFVARILTPVHTSRDVDVAANIEQIRTGDVERIRRALGFLDALAPRAAIPQSIVEPLLDHADQDIALRARDLLRKMSGEASPPL